MPEPTIVQSQPESPPTPSAPRDAPIAPEPRGTRKESFAEKWARHGGDVSELGKETADRKQEVLAEPEPEATPATQGEAEPAKPTEKPPEDPKPSHPQNAELSQLKELAKKLGMAFDGGRVTTAERAEFRDAKRRQRAQLDEERANAEREIQEHRQGLAQELETATQLFKARDDGDWNGLAKVLGFEDFTAFQREVATRVSDPNYRRMRELEEWKTRQEQEATERQQREEQAKIEQEQRAATETYKTQLADHMSGSGHPVLQALGRQTFFVNAIHAIQREQYDGDTTVTPEQALMLPAPGSSTPLIQELQSIYGTLHRAFGGSASPTPSPSPSQITKRDKDAVDSSSVKSAPVPPSSTSQASAPRKAPVDRREFAKWVAQRLDEEEFQDRIANRSR